MGVPHLVWKIRRGEDVEETVTRWMTELAGALGVVG
jgi:hypothetical protein